MKKFYLCLLTLVACNLAAQEWDEYPESLPHYWEAPDHTIYPSGDIWYFEEPGTWTFFKVNTDQERIDLFQREIVCNNVVEERESRQSNSSIYPNPINREANAILGIHLDKEQVCTIMIRDVNGRAVSSQSSILSGGYNSYELPSDILGAGLYFVTIEIGGILFHQKLIID